MNSKAVSRLFSRILCGAIVQCAFFGGVLARADSNPCPRFQPGSNVTQAADLFSHEGVLEVNLNYKHHGGLGRSRAR